VIRAVVDPGVLVSAFIAPRGSAPDQIVRAWAAGAVELLMSPLLIGELAGVLARPKFATQCASGRAAAYVTALAAGAVVLDDPTAVPALCRDPDDDYLLALAVAGRAYVVVSGDRDLTELAGPPVQILTPRAFVDRLEAESDG